MRHICRLLYILYRWSSNLFFFFFFQAEDGIRDLYVTGVQTCALPILAVVAATAAEQDQKDDDDQEQTHERPPFEGPRGCGPNVSTGPGFRPGGRKGRSEERRVGKECRSRWAPEHEKEKKGVRREEEGG